MRKVKEVIIVEGRYDKKTVENAVDATILETSGFGIFSDKDKLELIKRIAEKRGVIVMTDSDHSGFMIRNYLKNTLSGQNVKQAYLPDRYGKEKRKKSPTREGKLGVEGMEKEEILRALELCSAEFENEGPLSARKGEITKADMYALGLSGTPDSAKRRKILIKSLDLPADISTNALLDVLNVLYTKEELTETVSNIAELSGDRQ